MPQDDWVEDTLTPSNDWVEDTPQQPHDDSFLGNMFSGPNAVRMGGSMAADYIGGALTPITGGLSYPIVSFLGGAASEGIARYMEGQPFNPWIMGVEGAANLMPGPNIPGAGAGLKEIGEYGLKSAGYGAAQGLAGAVPRHMAETGNIYDPEEGFNLPSLGEVAGQTVGGAVVGGAVGTTLGAGHVAYHNRLPTEAAPPPPPGAREPWVDQTYDGRPLVQGPTEPVQEPLDFNAPLQGELNFGSYRGESGRFTNQGPGYKGPYHPGLLEPIPQQFDFGEPPTDTQGSLFGSPPPPSQPPPPPGGIGPTNNINITDPNVIPEGSNLSSNQQVVTISSPDAATIAYWRNLGYVSVPGLRSPEGFPQLVRGDVAPLYVTGDKSTPVAPQQPIVPQDRPEVPGPIGGDQVAAGDSVPIPNEKITASLVQNMEANGYKLVEKGPIASIFRRIMNSSERGALDLNGMWGVLKRMLGRDPTQQEIETAMARQIPEGTGGDIAQFPTQQRQEFQNIANRDNVTMGGVRPQRGVPITHPEGIGGFQEHVRGNEYWVTHPMFPEPQGPFPNSEAVGDWIMQVQDSPEFRRRLDPGAPDYLPPEPRVGEPIPPEPEGARPPELGDPLPPFPLDENGNRIVGTPPRTPEEIRAWYEKQAQIEGPSSYDPMSDMPGPEDPRWSENQGIDVAALRQRAMDPRMAARVDAGYGGPREFDFTQAPNQEGQMELPWTRGENPQPIDADAAARERQAAADRFRRPQGDVYQQESMMPQFFDAEIEAALKAEDGIPPESRDLGDYNPEFQREPPPRLQGGMYDAATAHLQQETNVNTLHGYLNMLNDAIRFHRTSGDTTELKLYSKLREEVVNRLNTITTSEGPVMQRPNDVRIGESGMNAGQRNFAHILQNSPTEELVRLRQQMAKDLEHWRNLVSSMPNNNEATGMIKRRVAMAETKLAAIEAAVQARLNPDEPAFARVPGGGLTASVDIRRAVENITKDYTSPLPGIMAREGLQNALDAADKFDLNGDVKIRMGSTKDGNSELIEIYDNGNGLDEEGLAKKLVEIFATGKEGEEGATGGKGIGSASYIYGGEHFKVESVAVDRTDGQKYRITASGTPEQFLDPVKGSEWEKVPVKNSEPTGTTIEVTLKDLHDIDDARTMVENITKNSRNRPSRIIVDELGHSRGTPLKHVQSDGRFIHEYRFESSKNDKMVGDFTTTNRNSDVKVLIPTFDPSISRNEIQVHYLNNGMYQFSESMHLDGMGDGVPDRVLVDIHPLVDDQNELYPFINTREDIKRDIRQEVVAFIKKNIASPGVERRKNRTQELYDSMSPVPVVGTKRKSIIFDPGNRFTPAEMKTLVNNPTVQALVQTYDKLVDDIITSTGRTKWGERLEGVGLVFDPSMHGVHIPNPTTKKSTILINPFIRIGDPSMSPAEASWRNTITNLHEVAHIGTESAMPIKWNPADAADPRLGEFVASYMNQLAEHGDVSLWTSTGHGMDFAHRLGEVYAKFGVDSTFKAADNIHKIVTGGQQSGGYSPEVQKLLQLYQTSRGRTATTEDLLSGTGVKQPDRGREGAGVIPSDSPTNGVGASPEVKKEKEVNWVREALALPTNATTMLDLSAPGRQGLAMVLTPEFWKATGAMFGALHYDTYKAIDANLRAKPLMTRKIDVNTGKEIPSFGEQIGTKLFSPASEPGPHAEMTASRWLEVGVGNDPLSKLWKNTAGVPIRATNRAFITFLNHLNVNRTEKLLNLARDMSVRGLDTGRTAMPGILGGIHLPGGSNIGFTQKVSPTEAMDMNPYHNLPLAKEIAEFVNAATGHATAKGGFSLENAVSKIGPVLFSPGLLNSRIRMMNPVTYAMATPFVRQQYAKAALSTAAAWYVSTQLLKNAAGPEAEVNNDPTNADFGKVRIGDARLDLGGGFLQFAVAYGRVYAGGATSSASGEFHRFGSGYQAQTSEDMAERFLVNKLNPIAKFAWDTASASEYNPMHMGDRTMQLFVPLFIQDLKEIAKEDPSLLPMFGTAALFGGGTQIYSKGESVSKFIDPENDWNVTGGGVRDLMPWNWGDDEPRNFPWSQPE